MSTTDKKAFYFSQKHKEYLITLSTFDYYPSAFLYTPSYFKGKEYTEVIDIGKTPCTDHFGDLVMLGTGTYNDIRFQP